MRNSPKKLSKGKWTLAEKGEDVQLIVSKHADGGSAGKELQIPKGVVPPRLLNDIGMENQISWYKVKEGAPPVQVFRGWRAGRPVPPREVLEPNTSGFIGSGWNDSISAILVGKPKKDNPAAKALRSLRSLPVSTGTLAAAVGVGLGFTGLALLLSN